MLEFAAGGANHPPLASRAVEGSTMPPRILPQQYVGKIFGHWTVKSYAGLLPDHHWLCICDCGTSKVVRGANLIRGVTTSCGCQKNRRLIERNTRHGNAIRGAKTSTYWSWTGMIQRCFYPRHKSFHNYGGRGIRICRRWLGEHGFRNFLSDMGERPSHLTLDRIKTDGHYTPENCRWATRAEQRRNQRKKAA